MFDTEVQDAPDDHISLRLGMADDLTTQLLAATKVGFPDRVEGKRPAHSDGVAAIGTFRGLPDASRYCAAEQFSTDPTPVVVRFSNSSGQSEPDYAAQIRGMAVKFYNFAEQTGSHVSPKPNGPEIEEADLICASVPTFFTSEPEPMIEFGPASIPKKVRRHGLWKHLLGMLKLIPIARPYHQVDKSGEEGVLAWAKDHPESHTTLASVALSSTQPPPASFARLSYHAVHTFEVEGNDGTKRMARFSLEPAEGVRDEYTDLTNLQTNYLRAELGDRLNDQPVRFTLRMQLADQWDDTSDPTVMWPSNRQQVLMGTLELTRLYERDGAVNNGERLSFNPGRIPNHIGLSDDAVLRARIDLYNRSQDERGADHCPVAVPPR